MMASNEHLAPSEAALQLHSEALTNDLLRYVAGVTTRAPSLHNTQPWRLVGWAHGMDIYADRGRLLPVVDPNGRQLHISVGAALEHATVGFHAIGQDAVVALLPDSDDVDLLARITCNPTTKHPSLDDWALLQATVDRHTHRHPFLPGRLPRQLLVELLATAERLGSHARLIELPGERQAVARLIREATRAQEANPDYRAEISAWTIKEELAPEGVSLSAAAPLRHDELRQRDFSLGGRRVWAPDADPEDPDLLVLWTDADAPEDWLITGRGLSAVLLRATCAGVAASPLNQPLEVSALREAIRRELRLEGPAQMLLRLGFRAASTTTGRRRVDDVFRIEPTRL